MVISGGVNKVAFYCRMNHRDRDYSQFLGEVKAALEKRYGQHECDMKIFFEVASGANPDRKKWKELKAEIQAGNIDTVVTVKTSMLARDWVQYLEFMKLCKKKHVDVICSRAGECAEEIFQRITEFSTAYFEAGGQV